MFSIESKKENGFEIFILRDNTTGTSAEIIPACGAILNAFYIATPHGMLNVIDGYASKQEFDSEAEAKGFKSCKLSPFVCRMNHGAYEFGGNHYTVNKFNLNGHAIHGLIYNNVFESIGQAANADAATLELIYRYRAGDKGYPFQYDCRIQYELKADNELSLTTFIKNHESNAIPVSDGWHPYFTFGGSINQLEMQMECDAMLEFDANLLPTGKTLASGLFNRLSAIGDAFLDNSFLISQNALQPALTLKDPEKKLQLQIFPDKQYPILQIYTPPHRHSIAIENLSGAPDSFNNHIGLTLLPAGKEISFKTMYKISGA